MDAGRVGQVADRPLLGRQGDDLAAEVERHPRAVRGQTDRADVLEPLALGRAGPDAGQFGRDANLEPLAFARRRVEPVEVTRLFEDDVAAADAEAEDREV